MTMPSTAGKREYPSHQRWFLALLGVFAVWWAILAVAPWDRKDWALENALTVPFVLALVAGRRLLPFSRISYTLIFTFLGLHTLGSHYTYSLVPYDQWFAALTGRTVSDLLGLVRNQYDRLVHFCFGLLLAYPIREVFLRVAQVRGFWGYYLPLDVTMALSMLYELIEWGAATIFGGDLGVAYLGTQGDPWDAQKDMAMASLGALVAMLVTAGLNHWLERDFAGEWAESLRVKGSRPLGEDEIARLWRRRSSDQRE